MEPTDHLILDATLSPHRSLSRRQARGVILGVGILSSALSIPFTLVGAWPVVGFLGLDVLALSIAFALSFRSAELREYIRVTSLEFVLSKVGLDGREREWRFNPLWVRLVRREHAEFGLLGLSLASRGRSVEFAGFIGPDAREMIARDVSRALAEARRGPRFDAT